MTASDRGQGRMDELEPLLDEWTKGPSDGYLKPSQADPRPAMGEKDPADDPRHLMVMTALLWTSTAATVGRGGGGGEEEDGGRWRTKCCTWSLSPHTDAESLPIVISFSEFLFFLSFFVLFDQGKRKEHEFGHVQETCRAISPDVSLPLSPILSMLSLSLNPR